MEKKEMIVNEFAYLTTMNMFASEEEKITIENTILENSGIVQILINRLNGADIGIELKPSVGHMIAMCTDGVPGMSILILYEMIKKLKSNGWKGNVITLEDFAYAFPDAFPIIYQGGYYKNRYTEIGEKYSKLWDAQKVYNQTDEMLQKCKIDSKTTGPDNMVDYIGYWKLLISDPE